ncbi:MAG TPA: dihydrofolate reductase family protein [Candidatus Limnocylindrales bacterium]|nr:dihydrofolate reductase family protein [Candidatus Limnocylindrales bacterium]
MGKVTTSASVSLDGFIAGPGETGFEHLFAWYEAGEVEYPSQLEGVRFSLTPADHAYLTAAVERIGVFVVGRRLFDLTDGWTGRHPLDKPVVVVTHALPTDWVATHPGAPFTFVTDGVAEAIEVARGIAGDRDIGLNAGSILSQALELGLVDEIVLDLAPVLLGGGTRFFDALTSGPILLDGPEITPGERITHLRYTVRRQA